MVTCGLDRQVKVWDIRTYKELHSYYSRAPVTSCDVSGTGVLAVGFGSTVQTWNGALAAKQRSPYLVDHDRAGRRIESLAFCPHDDVLALGSSGGVRSLLIPGAGKAVFDAALGSLADPTQNAHRRKETLVRSLLDKVQPSMITLDPNAIAGVDRAPAEVSAAERSAAREANDAARAKRGLDSLSRRTRHRRPDRKLRNKEANIIDAKREEIRRANVVREERERAARATGGSDGPKGALSRFFSKK
jgi:U3 small nucleolar RNA-associated protein 7